MVARLQRNLKKRVNLKPALFPSVDMLRMDTRAGLQNLAPRGELTKALGRKGRKVIDRILNTKHKVYAISVWLKRPRGKAANIYLFGQDSKVQSAKQCYKLRRMAVRKRIYGREVMSFPPTRPPFNIGARIYQPPRNPYNVSQRTLDRTTDRVIDSILDQLGFNPF